MILSLDTCNILKRIAQADKLTKHGRINTFAVVDNFSDITKSYTLNDHTDWSRNGKAEYEALMVELGFVEEKDIRKNKVCETLEVGYAVDLACESCQKKPNKGEKQIRSEAISKLRSILKEFMCFAKYTVSKDDKPFNIWEKPENIDLLVECGIIDEYQKQCIKIENIIQSFEVTYHQWPMIDLPDNVIIVTAQLKICYCEDAPKDNFDYSFIKDKPKSNGALVMCGGC